MLIEVPSFSKVKQKLLERGASYLYQTPYPTTHRIISLQNCNDRICDKMICDELICVDGLKHSFRLEEKKYGDALMITQICFICDYGEVEVFPPKQNRMVSKD